MGIGTRQEEVRLFGKVELLFFHTVHAACTGGTLRVWSFDGILIGHERREREKREKFNFLKKLNFCSRYIRSQSWQQRQRSGPITSTTSTTEA